MIQKLLFALVLVVCTSFANAQTINVNFDGYAGGTTAEALGVPGVSFNGGGQWTITGNFFSPPMAGQVLYLASTYSPLILTFTQTQIGYSFDFATNGATVVHAKGFLGANLVFTSSFDTSSEGPFRGSLQLSSFAFDRLELSTDGDVLFAIDNLKFSPAVSAASPAAVPALSMSALAVLGGLTILVGAFFLRRRRA